MLYLAEIINQGGLDEGVDLFMPDHKNKINHAKPNKVVNIIDLIIFITKQQLYLELHPKF